VIENVAKFLGAVPVAADTLPECGTILGEKSRHLSKDLLISLECHRLGIYDSNSARGMPLCLMIDKRVPI